MNVLLAENMLRSRIQIYILVSHFQERKERKVRFSDTNNDTVGMDNSDMLKGTYNEAESHNSFLEALNAWRKAGKPEESKTDENGKVKLNDVQKAWDIQNDKNKKGSFFANIDSKNNMLDLGGIPTW